MGEIADSLIDGEYDFFTGEYIGRGVGYPRTLNKQLPWGKRDYTASKDAALRGVQKFIKKRIKVTDITAIVNEYMPEPSLGLKRKCLDIQKDFGSFVKWMNVKYPIKKINSCYKK